MSPYPRRTTARPTPRGPLVFDVRALPRSPGSRRAETATVPAPADLGAGMVEVPEGAELDLEIRFESVAQGVLVTAAVTAPVAGECARCLEPLAERIEVTCQELFSYSHGEEDDDEGGHGLDGDLLDLEPALRDAVVLALPLAPLCREDCPGLCPECGALLAQAGPEHGHERAADPRWAGIRERAAQAAGPVRGVSPPAGDHSSPRR